MKNLKLIGFLMILASSLMFIQCTSDPIEGPQGLAGIDGVDGVDGVNGVDGVDGTATCVACHNDSHRTPIKETYATSVHATGTAWARGSSTDCAQCHGNEGYIDYVTTGAVNPAGYTGVISPMKCTTCHSKHGTFDFENDGNDFALRSFDPVSLVIDPTVTIDFGSTSNNCVTCHQPRNSYPVPAGTADVTITSSRFGPHHGPQSTVLEGIMGANIAGAVGYPGVGSAGHRTGASCTICHMDSETEGIGKHSWDVAEKDENGIIVKYANACKTCHTNGAPTAVTGYATDFQKLHDLLLAKGAITATGSTVSGTYPVKVAQAVWNYKTLEEDKSNGVHNPAYAKALLKNSIQAVE